MRRHLTFAATSVLVAAVHGGCSAALPDTGPNDAAGDDGPAMTRGREPALGGFVISLIGAAVEDGVVKTPAYTTVFGKIFDGATPAPVTWNIVAEGDGCRLVTPTVPFCSPGCGGSAACVEDGTCAPYPRALSLGRVHVEGLAGGPFDMGEIGGNYQPTAPVPYPPLPEGAKVEITAPGGALGPLRLASVGIAPLEVTSRVRPVSGQSLALAWKAPAQAGLSRIEVAMDLSHHGGSKGKIACDVPDNGTLAIPAAQITALLGLGVSGFPTVIVTRVASGSTATRLGRATLRVVASVERAVEIEGLHSCTANQDCPAGMTCQADLKCQ